MFKRHLTKADGRHVWLYAAAAMPPDGPAPSPPGRSRSQPHLRWHPFRAEWVVYAPHRQQRTFLPPPEYNPFAPTVAPAAPTELPAGAYDIAVFDNRFPSFTSTIERPPRRTGIPTARAGGGAEVVVYTQDATTSLGALPLWHIRLLVDVWADRTAALGARDDVRYVMPFENRGIEVGVTLAHPHGQIYAYPFVPPVAEREGRSEREYFEQHGTTLLGDIVAAEIDDGARLVAATDDAVAFVPAFARFPYEVWIAPRRPAARLPDLDDAARDDLARTVKTVLRTYDALWGRPLPYVMAVHQAPTDGAAHPECQLHVEIYGIYRTHDRLKYLAGSELGAGVFIMDAEPETQAAALRAARPPEA